jgi:cytochrome c peroxidase
MDTTNDGSNATFKTVLPLYRLPETGPWTWHGWQDDLNAAMNKSLTETMLGPEPQAEDAAALLAYFAALQPPPNPHRPPDGSLSSAATRGQTLFFGERAACANCHTPPSFTDGQIHDVGTGGKSDRYDGYNTPSLIGVTQKVRWMHDGRCRSLEELLTGPHDPATVSGSEPLSEQEVQDLIAYLKSL